MIDLAKYRGGRAQEYACGLCDDTGWMEVAGVENAAGTVARCSAGCEIPPILGQHYAMDRTVVGERETETFA